MAAGIIEPDECLDCKVRLNTGEACCTTCAFNKTPIAEEPCQSCADLVNGLCYYEPGEEGADG